MSTRPVVDLGAGRRVCRPTRSTSFVVPSRAILVVLAAVVACLAIFLVAVATGDYPVALPEVQAILFGADRGFATTVVREWRMPRAVGAAVFGAALAVGGALLQSLTRNPLGSPDVIGFNGGAFTGALIAIGWFGGSLVVTSGFAFAGGLLAALLIYAVAYRRGLSGFRFLVIGIAVSSALVGVNTLLLLRMSTIVATVSSIWGQGTLENLRWSQVVPMALVILAVFLVVGALSAPLRQLELGDDVASATGVTREPARRAILITSVALTAIVTSVCGPIAFIALAAPHVARRLAGGPSLVASAAVGAVLLSASDLIASHLLPVGLPAGVVTVVIGGAYLVWLVIREGRRP